MHRSLEHIFDEKENPAVGYLIADNAAQFEVTHWTTPACDVKSMHNNCVVALPCKPEVVKKTVRKWGKRGASAEVVMKNYCAVIYGLLANDHRPSAHHCSIQLGDLLHFTKIGFALHGGWLI